MILIAHRGNLHGPNPERENHPTYIDEALEAGYSVEIDAWSIDGEWWLGHDEPTYPIPNGFLLKPNLWCHAKNFEALVRLRVLHKNDLVQHYFWHQEDDFAITSEGYIWTYPGKPLSKSSIAVMPELVGDVHAIDKSIYGICSDYVYEIAHPNSSKSAP